MPLLTAEMLNVNNVYRHGRFGNYGDFYAGQRIYQQGQASVVEFTNDTAVCAVADGRYQHTVTLHAQSSSQLSVACTCEQAASGLICKHIVASFAATSHYIYNQASQSWEYRLLRALDTAPRPPQRKPRSRFVVIFTLLHRENWREPWALEPHAIKAQDWRKLRETETSIEADLLIRYLDEDRSWLRVVSPLSHSLIPEGCLNLPPTMVPFVNTAFISSGYYHERVLSLAHRIALLA